MVVPLGVNTPKVQVVVVVVNLGRHPGRHDEETVGGEHQDLVVRLVALELQLDRDLEQDLGVFAQDQADRLVNVTGHAASGRHGGHNTKYRP